MVGTQGRMEELPRPVAFGGIRGVFRAALRAVPAEHEGIADAIPAGQGTVVKGRPEPPQDRSPRAHLDGAEDRHFGDRWEVVSGPDLFKGRLCAANDPANDDGSAESGPGPRLQRDDAGLLQDL